MKSIYHNFNLNRKSALPIVYQSFITLALLCALNHISNARSVLPAIHDEIADTCKLPPMLNAIGMTGGYHAVCPGETRTYLAKPLPGITYLWTVPNGANINSGQGTNSISVTYDSSFVSSPLSVQTVNNCGMSLPFSKLIIRNNLNPPDYISVSGGSTNLCYGDERTFTVDTAIGQGISYFWTVPQGATLLNGQYSTSINVRFDTLYAPTVKVTAARVNACGISNPREKALYLNAIRPSAPGFISGENSLCPGDTVQLTSSSPDTSIAWQWFSFNSTIQFISGQGTNSVTAVMTPGYAGGQIEISVKSLCNGLERFRARNLFYKGVPEIPSGISGQGIGLCGQQHVPFSLQPVPNEIYHWSIPGTFIVSGQGTPAIEVNFGTSFFNGVILVNAENNCGLSETRARLISSSPATPDPISGPATVCSNSINNIYTINPVFSATSYRWIGPTGSTVTANGITSTGNTLITTSTTVSVDYGAVTSSSLLKVRAINACANGGVRTLSLTPCLLRTSKNSERMAEVYPNPSSGKFTVELSDPLDFKKVVIEDIYGQIVYSEDLFTESMLHIALPQVKDGYYNVKLYGDTGIITKHIFIKQ